MVRIDEDILIRRRAEHRIRRGGRKPLPPEVKLSRSVYVRMSEGLFTSLSDWAALSGVSVPQYIVRNLENRRPKLVPAINKEVWTRLAPLSANFNQAQHHINSQALAGEIPDLRHLPVQIEEAIALLREVREQLMGADGRDPEQDECDIS